MTRKKKKPPEVRYRWTTFVTGITASPSNIPLVHVWVPVRPADHGLWSLDEPCSAPVAFTVIKLTHTYRKPVAEGEDEDAPLPMLAPTHEAHIAAGWEYRGTSNHFSHYIGHDLFGVMPEDELDSAASRTTFVPCQEHADEFMRQVMDEVQEEAEEEIRRDTKRLAEGN
jgi:hypothetical protein